MGYPPKKRQLEQRESKMPICGYCVIWVFLRKQVLVDQNQNPISEITTPLKSQLGELSPFPFFERILAWFGLASPQIDPLKVLSERELKIFRLLGLGKYNWEIAFRYFISVDSIDAIIRTIARKLRVSTRDLQRLGAEFNGTADEPMD